MALENIASIILLSKCSRLAFQIRLLTLNLAISDLLTGISLTLRTILTYDVYQCDLTKIPVFFFTNVSLLIFTMMNLDRCFAFTFAMRYYSFINEKLIIKLCSFTWVLGFILTCGMLYSNETSFGLSCEIMAFVTRNGINVTFRCITLCIVVPNIAMLGYLLHCIRSGLRKVRSQSVVSSSDQSRTVRKIVVLTGVFLAAYFPLMMIYTFPIFDLSSNPGRIIYIVLSSCVLHNSACNPVFYVWRFREPRYHMKKLLCFWNKDTIDSIERRHKQAIASYEIYATSNV